MRFQPRHVVAITALAAAAVVLHPVAAQAASALVSIADNTTGTTAKVDTAGNLAVAAHTADPTVKLMDTVVSMKGPLSVNTSGYRTVQVYAYPYNKDPFHLPSANSLIVKVPFAANGPAPAVSLPVASWGSGTPAGVGDVHSLTRTELQNSLQFSVTSGDCFWRVVVLGMK